MATHRPMRSCRLEDSLYLKAKYIADQEHRSFNNWIEIVIRKTVESYEAEHGTIAVNPDDLYQ